MQAAANVWVARLLPAFSFSNETQKDSGSTYDEVPQTLTTGLGSKMVDNMTMEEVDTPNALTKAESTSLKAASAAVSLVQKSQRKHMYMILYIRSMQRPVGSYVCTMFPTQNVRCTGWSSKMTTT